jgi:hypothetical protein
MDLVLVLMLNIAQLHPAVLTLLELEEYQSMLRAMLTPAVMCELGAAPM